LCRCWPRFVVAVIIIIIIIVVVVVVSQCNHIHTHYTQALRAASNAVASAAARCLGTIANGPRIASTPLDSLLHPSQMFFKKLVISEGVVPLLINMISCVATRRHHHHPHPNHLHTPINSSHHAETRDEAVLALASIAEHDPTARDFVLAARALPPLLNLIQAASPLTTVRKAVRSPLLCRVVFCSDVNRHKTPQQQQQPQRNTNDRCLQRQCCVA
jgi:hypothetical protein